MDNDNQKATSSLDAVLSVDKVFYDAIIFRMIITDLEITSVLYILNFFPSFEEMFNSHNPLWHKRFCLNTFKLSQAKGEHTDKEQIHHRVVLTDGLSLCLWKTQADSSEVFKVVEWFLSFHSNECPTMLQFEEARACTDRNPRWTHQKYMS